MASTLRLAVFGDLHGRALLAFWLAKRWQKEHGETIDQILCVGDVGVYRSLDRMDKASRRFAGRYPDELGFPKFFYAKDPLGDGRIRHVPVVDDVLEELVCNLYFVPGNHEEHQHIGLIRHELAEDPSAPVAVDLDWTGISNDLYRDGDFKGYGRIFCLPEGATFDLRSSRSSSTPVTLRAINGIEKYTMPEAWNTDGTESVDILLTHEAPMGRLSAKGASDSQSDYGSEKLDGFIKKLGPYWHFFGHHHRYCPEAIIKSDAGRGIHSIGLNQLFFKTGGSTITQDAFGVLRVEEEGGSHRYNFTVVDDPWYRNLRYSDVTILLCWAAQDDGPLQGRTEMSRSASRAPASTERYE